MTLVDRYGITRVAGAAIVLLVVLYYGATVGLAKTKAWYYERKVERVTDQRDTARAETKVARQDEAQVTRSAGITATTVAAQDQHAAAQRTATAKTVETIHDQIRRMPIVAPLPDDTVVRNAVAEARARAQAASDRVRGTAAD